MSKYEPPPANRMEAGRQWLERLWKERRIYEEHQIGWYVLSAQATYSDGKRWFLVEGRFPSKEDAQAARKEFKAEKPDRTWIVRFLPKAEPFLEYENEND